MSFKQDAAFTEKRWTAIKRHVEDVTKSNLALLGKLAFRLKLQMGASEVAALRQVLAGDATQPGDDELIMLSASALAVAMNSDTDSLAALAATVVSSMSCGGLRELKQPMDLVGMADNVLLQLAETARRRPSLEQVKLVTPAVDKSDAALAQELLDIAQQSPGYTSVLNGRFKGGYITRNYGQPEQGVHAVQLEMTQSSYMQEQMPFDYLPETAARIQPTMQRLLQAVLAFAQSQGRAA